MLLTGQRTPFTGRAAERARLVDVVAGTRGRPGATVAVTGEAGIGKSRLLAEVLSDAAVAGALVLEAQCFEADRGLPYAPLLDLLRDGGEANPQLRALLESEGEAEQRRRALYYAVDDLFARRTAEQHVVLVFEDLHWCDEATLDFLSWFSARLSARPLLVLLTWRTDERSDALSRLVTTLERQRLLTEIRLGPFDRWEAERMIRAVLPRSQARSYVVDAIARLTDGNPFFIEEVLRSTPAEVLRSAELPDVPRTVHDAVQRRVDGLSDRARQVLLLAAVTGREFDFQSLSTLASTSEEETLACVRELVERHLVRERSADRFAFRHALSREAVLALLLARERRALHAQVARILEARTDGNVEPGDLGSHWFAAEEWERAQPHLLEAGERALALHAPAAALAFLDRAIDATHVLGRDPAPAVHLHRAHAFDALGDFNSARTDYEVARALAVDEGNAEVEWQATLDLGLLWTSRDYERAGERYRRALELAQSSGDERRIAHSLNRLGNWHGNVDEPDIAVSMHEEALAILERFDDALARGRTLDLLGTALYMQGDLLRSVDACERAIALLEQQGDLPTLSSALSMRIASSTDYTQTLVVGGVPLPTVHDLVARARKIAREISQPSAEAFTLLQSAQALSLFGDLGTARSHATEALGIAASLGHSQWISGTRQALGMVHLELLEPARARAELEQSLLLARELNSTVWESVGCRSLVSACLASGDVPRAREIVDSAHQQGRGTSNLTDRMVWYATAQVAVAEDRATEALDIVDHLIASAANMADGVVIPALWWTRGGALAALGRTDDARSVLLEAIRAAEIRGLRPLLWRLHLALAHVTRSARDQAEAAAHLAGARDVLRGIATTLDPVDRERFLARAREAIPDDPHPPRRSASHQSHLLTDREVEVLRLAASGLSNAEIAQRLVVSDRTVGNHLTNIYGKLGASGRTARATAVAYAFEHGLANRAADHRR